MMVAPSSTGQQLRRPHEFVIDAYLQNCPKADAKQAEGVYDFLSNFTHPTLYATRELFQYGADGAEETVTLAVDAEYHEKLARLAIAPFYATLARLTAHHRWSDKPLKALEAHIDLHIPGTLAGLQTL